MIQRIQTVYLALAVILSALLFFFPLAELTTDNAAYIFDIFGLKSADGTHGVGYLIPLILNAATIIIGIMAIFLFKKRPLQIKLTQLNLLLYTAFIALLLFYVIEDAKAKIAESAEEVAVSYDVAVFFPIAALIVTFLAMRAIKKDEELVRSANRIR